MRKERTYRVVTLTVLLLSLLLLVSCMDDKVKAPESGNVSEEMADIIIGVEKEHAPWFWIDKDGKGKGIYADLLREMSKKAGFSYAFLPVDSPAAKAALQAGTIHCYLGSLVPPTGEKLGLWQSDLLFQSSLCLAVPGDSNITEPAGMKGKEAAAVKGTPGERYAVELAGKYHSIPVTFPSQSDVLRDIEQGLSAAAASDFACIKAEGEDYRILEVSDNIKNVHYFFTIKYDGRAKKLAKALKMIRKSGKLEDLAGKIPQP